jgi:alpha,alpha-trehalose phosphorylase
VRDFDGDLTFTPALPRTWKTLSFSLRFRGRQIRVRLSHQDECYLIEEGEPLTITVRGEPHVVALNKPVELPAPGSQRRLPGDQLGERGG